MESSTTYLWTKTVGYLVAVFVLLLVGVQLIQQLPAWRMDLTEEGIYTLSQGTQDVVRDTDVSITLDFYFSASLASEVPQFKDYARRIEDLLHEYAALNPDYIHINVIDPEPFSEAEDEAVAQGLQGAPLSLGGDSLYMGLVGRQSNDTSTVNTDEGLVSEDGVASDSLTEVISFFSPEREQFLEYDISRLVYRLGQVKAPVLGLLSSQSMMGGFDFARRQPSSPWAVIEQIQQVMEVRSLSPSLSDIDEDVDVLMIVHPQNLSDQVRYAIDQYVLTGGKLMVFLDPHFEGMPQGPVPSSGQANGSSLNDLLTAWGVSFSNQQVVGDSQWGLRLAVSEGGPALPHVGIFGLRNEAFDEDSVVTAELETVNMASAGYFTAQADASTDLSVLLHSSDQAMAIPLEKMVGLTNHGDLLVDFVATGERYPLAVSLTGTAKSAFSARPEPVEDDSEETQDNSSHPKAPHINESEVSGIRVMLFSDVDILTDRLWVQVSNFFGQRVAVPWANNGDLVVNAVEALDGSDSLIGIRSRGQYTRPFTRVNDLRNEAASQFKAQEKILLEELEALESNIQALNNPENGGQLIELNDSQRDEVKRFEEQRLQVRKDLRQVQHKLNQSIDALELRLKLVNMLLIPALLLSAMIALFVYRRRQV
jgi:gliding motility-associatede transport system auxiliary component